MDPTSQRTHDFLTKHRFVVCAIIAFIIICLGFLYFSDEEGDFLSDSSDTTSSSCNVYGFNLHGELVTYIPETVESDRYLTFDQSSAEEIAAAIQNIQDDPDIKGIIIEVDSPGGSPVAGEEIANAIKQSTKPVVAYIRGVGASASYWAISSSDKIYASKNSDIGSIGVTMSYLDNVKQNDNDGLSYVQLSSGKYKDAGSPDRPLTADEKVLFERDIKIIHQNFIEDVANNRGLKIEDVTRIADGSTVLGARAKELGLIDEIGAYADAEKYIEDMIGESAEVCW